MHWKRELTLVILTVGVALGEPQEPTTADPSISNNSTLQISCRGKLAKISTSDELYDELLPRIIHATDTEDEVIMKKEFLRYLVRSATFNSMVNCTMAHPPHEPRLLQEDGDDDDDGGGAVGGGFAGAINTLANGPAAGANPLDNTNVLLGVRRILANVFTGNLVGIIQESVGLRSPEGVSNVFTDVLSTLFGSTATAGITGIVGNITTTISPYPQEPQQQNETEYYQQVYLQQQYIQQLQQQGVLDQAQAVALQHQLLAQAQAQQGGAGTGVVGVGAGGVGVQGQTQQQFQQQIVLQQQQQSQQYRPQSQPQIRPLQQQQQQQQQSPISASQLQPQQQQKPAQTPVKAQTDDLQQYFAQTQAIGGGSVGGSAGGGGRRRRPIQIQVSAAAASAPLAQAQRPIREKPQVIQAQEDNDEDNDQDEEDDRNK